VNRPWVMVVMAAAKCGIEASLSFCAALAVPKAAAVHALPCAMSTLTQPAASIRAAAWR
jgi:hypothetical protein